MTSKRWLVVRSRRLPVSFWLERRVFWVLLVLSLLLLGVLSISLGYGDYQIPPLDVLKTLLGIDTGNADYGFILYTLRLPRVLVALVVGMGLALSGAILQSLTRNPLAAPDIIGVNAGAGLAAVFLIVLLPGLPLPILPIAAFGGALLAAILIYSLSWQEGSSPLRLILMGVGIGEIANALKWILIIFGNINEVSQALVWMAGSVYGRTWEHLAALVPWLLLCVPVVWLRSPDLNVLSLGDAVARGLGSQVERQRLLLLLTSVALAGSSVAIAGTIGFVGLMAPHLARQLVGPSHMGLLPTTALMGGLIVVLADFLGRSLFAPIEIPCGVITAMVGAPYFLYLLYRNRNS